MNLEEDKMRVIIEYFAEHFPSPYTIEAVPITRPQSAMSDDRKVRVLRDGKVAYTVIVSSALLSDVSPSPTRLAALLEEKLIADKLKRSAEFRLNHYELGTESPNR
jgi:hypothetical protein